MSYRSAAIGFVGNLLHLTGMSLVQASYRSDAIGFVGNKVLTVPAGSRIAVLPVSCDRIYWKHCVFGQRLTVGLQVLPVSCDRISWKRQRSVISPYWNIVSYRSAAIGFVGNVIYRQRSAFCSRLTGQLRSDLLETTGRRQAIAIPR